MGLSEGTVIVESMGKGKGQRAKPRWNLRRGLSLHFSFKGSHTQFGWGRMGCLGWVGLGLRETCIWYTVPMKKLSTKVSKASVWKRSLAYAVSCLRLDTAVGGRRPGCSRRDWKQLETHFCVGNCSIHWVVTNPRQTSSPSSRCF